MGRFSKFITEIQSGDRLRALEALRLKLAQAAERATDGKELAALSLRLERVTAEIAVLEGGGQTEEDDLAQRRRAKLSAAGSQ